MKKKAESFTTLKLIVNELVFYNLFALFDKQVG